MSEASEALALRILTDVRKRGCVISHFDRLGNPTPCPGYPHTTDADQLAQVKAQLAKEREENADLRRQLALVAREPEETWPYSGGICVKCGSEVATGYRHRCPDGASR